MRRRSFLQGSILLFLKDVLLGGGGVVMASEAAKKHSKPVPKVGKYLEYMTWKEAEPELKASEVVLIPLGARLKEHGLHLPLNNDWIMAEYLTRRVLDQSAVLATPTVQFGFYPAFVEYPGSIHISKDTCRDFIADICRSLHRHGPKKFYVLNTGVSTNRALEPARQLLAKEGITLEYTDLLATMEDIEKKVRTQSAGTHADEIETSMMLYIAPEIVNMKLAQKDIHTDHGPGGLTRDPNATTGVYSPSGAWGDPTLATREKGQIVVEALVGKTVAAIGAFQSKDYIVAPPRDKYL